MIDKLNIKDIVEKHINECNENGRKIYRDLKIKYEDKTEENLDIILHSLICALMNLKKNNVLETSFHKWNKIVFETLEFCDKNLRNENRKQRVEWMPVGKNK